MGGGSLQTRAAQDLNQPWIPVTEQGARLPPPGPHRRCPRLEPHPVVVVPPLLPQPSNFETRTLSEYRCTLLFNCLVEMSTRSKEHFHRTWGMWGGRWRV